MIKFLQTGSVMIGLSVVTLMVALIVILNGHLHFLQLVYTVPVCLFVFFVCGIFNWIHTKKKKRWLMSVLGVAIVIALITPIQHYYKLSIPTVDAEIDISAYQPFTRGNQVVKPDEKASLHLTESLPRLDGATAMYPLYAAFVEAIYPKGDYQPYNSKVQVSRTPEAYQNLIVGNVDLIFVAAPSVSQEWQAEKEGLTFDMAPIGREAFVFFVHHKNSVDNVTLEQVKKIYAGEITNWRDVGGKDEAIRAFQRPADSGSQTALEKLMGNMPIMKAPSENIASGMGGIIHEVSQYRNYKNAIGYTFRYYSTEMVQNKKIKLLSIDGVAPTKENIRNGTYPLVSEFYAVTAGTENENVQKLIDWILTDEGQALVEKVGYVPVENY
ncbi:PstS family phosphate ABC transporter substrate-binding protein [Lysinibacillus fusiformis]|uniref:PstS family phosphate ABC transporter substrate-binding protein n=1 Tax=Lysinibacillus fusiformis TaxID=28031 RepID=UPI00215B5E2C|nr:substrate-binding domain-containing protein [Lysinibacillus fusiformis]MCR8851774.1 substrate-binding domain-containing protein [Lysinibacillus fusiformis]